MPPTDLTALYAKLGALGVIALYALARKSLSPGGVVAAVVTGLVHAAHPWDVFFVLPMVFFVAGTLVTKVKHAYKSSLTTPASGAVASAPHPRTAYQVLCNSLPATLAVGLHAIFLFLKMEMAPGFMTNSSYDTCLPHPTPTETTVGPPSVITALPYGIFAFYAAVTADTFASELGILSWGEPFLVTTLPFLLGFKSPKRVPRGTNGGVSFAGILASAVGGAIIAANIVFLTPFCKSERKHIEIRTAYAHQYTALGIRQIHLRRWTFEQSLYLGGYIVLAGVAGALLDSLLGARFQASVVDQKTGKIVEGQGGAAVQYSEATGADKKAGRRLVVGRDVLSNNGVNLAMGILTLLGTTTGVAVFMGTTVNSFLKEIIALVEFLPLLWRYILVVIGQQELDEEL